MVRLGVTKPLGIGPFAMPTEWSSMVSSIGLEDTVDDPVCFGKVPSIGNYVPLTGTVQLWPVSAF